MFSLVAILEKVDKILRPSALVQTRAERLSPILRPVSSNLSLDGAVDCQLIHLRPLVPREMYSFGYPILERGNTVLLLLLLLLLLLRHAQGTPPLTLQSYIRKGKYRPATTTTPAAAAPSRSGYPPLTLQRAGLESSGRRLNS